MIRSDFLKRLEWALAILLSATALFLLAIRATHAGALWRDECAVVNLARMPSVADIWRNFQHEAFPVPFQLLVRAYTDFFGSSDFALRAFGIAAGVAVLCALWISAKLIGKDPPLLSLALLGLNTSFLVWGTTVRGYGLGSTLIILVFGLLASAILKPSCTKIAIVAVLAVASAQCLIHNLALVSALLAAATIVCLARHRSKNLIIFLGILALCLVSFVPYMNAYSTRSEWSQVVEFPVTPHLLWKQVNFALGNPTRAYAWIWHIAFIILLVSAIWQLLHPTKSTPQQDLLLFTSLTAILVLIAYYEFLHMLSYLTRSWYFLALISILAAVMDCLAAILSQANWMRISRLVFAALALIILPINAWPKIIERQTNIDIVAEKVSALAKPSDLIVVAPWQYGISFKRYYHGATPWITLPTIGNLQVHRYDLMLEKMLAEHPIDDVLEKIRQALANGNRVWFVGGFKIPPEGKEPLSLPPAPNVSFGWDNAAYTEAWLEQLGAFVRTHSASGQTIPLALAGPVNFFEDVPLILVEGW